MPTHPISPQTPNVGDEGFFFHMLALHLTPPVLAFEWMIQQVARRNEGMIIGLQLLIMFVCIHIRIYSSYTDNLLAK